ncbi:hypothetical protein pipiens_006940 [Culex pipiens pipiens]|uniref:Uncharacterized protein n=1 Tax=Culex pipiens pipiens TaxID=38569 RepID=A0ABD1DMQ2_CULPP
MVDHGQPCLAGICDFGESYSTKDEILLLSSSISRKSSIASSSECTNRYRPTRSNEDHTNSNRDEQSDEENGSKVSAVNQNQSGLAGFKFDDHHQ